MWDTPGPVGRKGPEREDTSSGLTGATISSARFSSILTEMSMRPTGLAAAGLFSLGIGLAGCGSDPQQDYSDVHARLDAQDGQIILPLEAYAMTPAEEQEVAHANALLINDCLAEGGRTHLRATQDWDAIPALPDRRYGIWSRPDAEANGYELPQSPDADELNAQEEALGEDWWGAFETCQSERELIPMMGINTSMEMSPVDQGMNETFEAMIASSELATIKAEWTNCITTKGLAPNPDSTLLVPVIPASKEEQLRVAAIDVECKESLNSVQPLADYEARLQMAYIDQRESELIAYRDQVDEVLAKAREVLATHEG